MPILIFDWWRSLACQKFFLDTFNDLINANTKSSLLSDNSAIDDNVNIDTKVKSNPHDNMISKNNNDFCENNL